MIVQLDLITSSQIRLPRMMKDWQSDTAEPRNLLDGDFDVDVTELPDSRPGIDLIPLVYFITKNNFLSVFGMISDLTTSTKPSPHDEVMKLDQLLREAVGLAFTMPASNKDRLYVALYARGGQDPNTYHWAIIVGPKEEVEGGRGYRYHVRQRLDPARPGRLIWAYESLEIPLAQTSMLLGRIMIAKITDKAQIRSTLAAVRAIQDDPSWTCRIWVKDAITALEADGKSLGTRITKWTTIEQNANNYIRQKRQQRRYDGSGSWVSGTVPTFDLLENREIVP